MTPEEIQALAERIAQRLLKRQWIEGPVRPEPPGRPTAGALPAWSGAAQPLGDIAPVVGRKTRPGRHRVAYDGIVVAARGAAAGRAPSPIAGGIPPRVESARSGRSVPIGVSNRHIHIAQHDCERLFGPGASLTPDRPITQPGQFAARERVRIVGPDGSIDGVRIVGPARSATQVEFSASDARQLGVAAPVRGSGNITGSAAIRLEGPAGSVELREGAIVAARHVHVSPADAARFGLADGDRIAVALGTGDRSATLDAILVRSGDKHATELHLDTDEACAFGVKTGDVATIIGRPTRSLTNAKLTKRSLITERDVHRLAADGVTLSDKGPYLVTPAAKDRAKALGIWRDGR